MIYVDTPFEVDLDHPTAPKVFKGKLSAHLMADDELELIYYAISIGMSINWIQKQGTYLCHFDATGKFLRHVLADSTVTKLAPKEMAKMWMAKRDALKTSSNPEIK